MLSSGKASRVLTISPPSFEHLRRLTDDTGLIEHALGRIPRRREGYTTDDNARALWTATEWLSAGEDALGPQDSGELCRLADIYLAFMLWAQEGDGWFRNNFAYDRSLEPEEVSHDCQGRSIWACADAWIRLSGPRRDTAKVVFERALPTMGRIDSLRGQAFAMASCAHVLQAADEGEIELPADVGAELRHHLSRLETVLCRAYDDFADDEWRWFEPAMTYSNGVFPWAMLRTSRYTLRQETYRKGRESLRFLVEAMDAREGGRRRLRPIGNDGWCTSDSGAVSQWDQQPLEMFKLALALREAELAGERFGRGGEAKLVGSARGNGSPEQPRPADRGSGEALGRRSALGEARLDGSFVLMTHGERVGEREAEAAARKGETSRSRELRGLCRSWFYGANDLGVPVVDPADGSCCDGLTPYGPNINCGAEAAISYLMTEALCRDL